MIFKLILKMVTTDRNYTGKWIYWHDTYSTHLQTHSAFVSHIHELICNWRDVCFYAKHWAHDRPIFVLNCHFDVLLMCGSAAGHLTVRFASFNSTLACHLTDSLRR